MAKKKEEAWMKQYWRPIMAFQYVAVCLFDFMVAPVLQMLLTAKVGIDYVQWASITLSNGGLYHLAMGAILGVAAWTRGQEKITRINAYGDENIEESSSTSQTPMN
jgi:hypothetical protein